MKVETARSGDVLSVSVKGRIDASTAPAFEEALRHAIADTDRAVLVDLAELTCINSAGLCVLLTADKSLHARRQELALCALTDAIAQVFAIAGFDKMLRIHGTEAEALTSMAR